MDEVDADRVCPAALVLVEEVVFAVVVDQAVGVAGGAAELGVVVRGAVRLGEVVGGAAGPRRSGSTTPRARPWCRRWRPWCGTRGLSAPVRRPRTPRSSCPSRGPRRGTCRRTRCAGPGRKRRRGGRRMSGPAGRRRSGRLPGGPRSRRSRSRTRAGRDWPRTRCRPGRCRLSPTRSPTVKGAVAGRSRCGCRAGRGSRCRSGAVQPWTLVTRSAAAMFSKDTAPADALTASRPVVWVESWAVMTGL